MYSCILLRIERVSVFYIQNSLGQGDMSEIISFGMLWWE